MRKQRKICYTINKEVNELKRTFITSMPDRIGAFLAANEKLSSIGVNITRVSYNKAIDTHTLFLEIDGEESLLIKAEEILTSLGYIKKESAKASVILLEFHLKDEPNRLHPILVLIQTFNFNISYMSSQQNETGYQDFKIGIYVEDETNGLLTYDREIVKVDIDFMKRINEQFKL